MSDIETKELTVPASIHSEKNEDSQYKFHYFTEDTIGVELTKSLKRTRQVEREEVRTMMKSPFDNAVKLQGVSEHMKATNGHYYRMIKYLANLLTFDYVVYPKINGNKMGGSTAKIAKGYHNATFYLKLMNLKHNMRFFLERLITNGEVYLYKLEDKNSIIYKELPPALCKAMKLEDNVLRFGVKLSSLTADTVLEYPAEIQNAWKRSKTNKDIVDKDGYFLVGDCGFCFNAWGAYSKGFPVLSFMFDTLIAHEETTDAFEDQMKLDALKLIHQKVPLDENDMPIFDKNIIQMYHNATKKNLPSTVSITTNPMELSSVNFDKSALRNKDNVTISEDNIFSTGGISKLLFNNVSASGEGLKKSALTDEMLMYPFLEMFAHYVNYELRGQSGVSFEIKFLHTSHFNIDEKHKLAKEDLTLGGSRQMFFATQGLEPYETMSILQLEQAIGIDELIIPVESSYTQSGDEGDGDTATDTGNTTGGRPEEDEVTDSGDKSRQNE